MNGQQVSVEAMIAAARRDPNQSGPLLERYRGFLLIEGQRRIGAQVAARLDPGDIVQETFAKAVRPFGQFSGTTEPEFTSWVSVHGRRP